MTRSSSRADVLVPLLACLVEGAGIAVADALFAAGARRPPLGPLIFALAAAVGLAWVRRAAPDAQRPGLVAIGAIAFVGGAVLARGEAVFAPDAFPAALIAEPAAWLAAIAVVRGAVHRDPDEEDLVVGDLLRYGVPLLTIPWLLGAALPPDTRGAFIAAAFPATVLLAGAGLLALGLARLEALAYTAGVDWRRNRAWFVLLTGVVGLVLVVAIPAGLLLGEPLGRVLSSLAGPFAALFTPLTALVGVLLLPILSALVDLLRSLLRPFEGEPQEPPPTGPSGPLFPPGAEPPGASDLGSVLATAVTLLAIVVGLIVLARLIRAASGSRTRRTDPSEEHEFLPPPVSLHLPPLRRPVRAHRPATATGAYLAFLSDAERTAALARRPNEGPETHARRVRGDAHLADADRRAAALLAADYELERYALRDLPARETRRALSRWQRLRESLRSRPGRGRQRD